MHTHIRSCRSTLFLLLFLGILLILPVVRLHAQIPSYNDVMLVINDSSRSSVEIGAYFASRRGIPANHIYHMKRDTNETIDSAAFIPLQWQIQSWMAARNLADSINYIVTTKGCPLRVQTSEWDRRDASGNYIVSFGGQCSFEDCLALINGEDSVEILTVKDNRKFSRYFGSGEHFKRSIDIPYYLVTRLDGYTVDQVKQMIQKAEHPVLMGEGLWVLDVDPSKEGGGGYKIGNDWLRKADTILRNKGLRTFYDATDSYIHGKTNVIGYASWGSNDAHSGGGEGAKPGNTWLDGSVAETYVSTGGRSFQAGAGYGQSLVADWIAEGVSAVKGYTDEPYLDVMAQPSILFDRYTSGFNMAESYWSASQWIAWRQVVIGDPKMRLGLLLTASTSALALGSGGRYEDISRSITVRNVWNAPVEIRSTSISGADSSDFRAAGTFPQTIQPGDSLSISVIFRPKSTRAEKATLRLWHQRGGSDTISFLTSVALSGTGLKPTMTAPDTLYFGKGTSTRTVALGNAMAADTITITKVAITGLDAAKFKIDPTIQFPYKIVGGGKWDLPITYTPTGQIVDNATMTVTSNASKSVVVRLQGNSNVSGVVASHRVESEVRFVSVSPNPFGSSAIIRYLTTAERGEIQVDLLDLLGREVMNVGRRMEGPGEHSFSLDAQTLPSGTYFCRLTVTTPSGARIMSMQSLFHNR